MLLCKCFPNVTLKMLCSVSDVTTGTSLNFWEILDGLILLENIVSLLGDFIPKLYSEYLY